MNKILACGQSKQRLEIYSSGELKSVLYDKSVPHFTPCPASSDW